VPRAGSRWDELWPDVAGARSLVVGVCVWADAIPIDTSRRVAANNAEFFLMICSFVTPVLNELDETVFRGPRRDIRTRCLDCLARALLLWNPAAFSEFGKDGTLPSSVPW
jgi:hypothetical protein